MDNLGFGLSITLAGMGSVFALLLLLTGLLVLIGKLDRRSAGIEAPAAAVPRPVPDPARDPAVDAPPGMDPALVAAIGVAVSAHVRELRRQAGPAMRTHPTGSLDHASRWVATGRAAQTQPWRRG